MAEVLLFHHAPGRTAGCHAFADEVRDEDRTVHTPDRYAGRTFGTNAAIPQDPRHEAPDKGSHSATTRAPTQAGSRAGGDSTDN